MDVKRFRSRGGSRGKTLGSKPQSESPVAANSFRDTIHAVISKSGNVFVVECLEVAVVTQGRTLDESLANLREAVALHLNGEDLEEIGLTDRPRISVTYELPVPLDAEA